MTINHSNIKEKCYTCGQEFTNREVQVKHIVDKHTDMVEQDNNVDWSVETGQWTPRIKCQRCGSETTSQNELEYHVELMHQKENPSRWCHRCKIEVNWDNTVTIKKTYVISAR